MKGRGANKDMKKLIIIALFFLGFGCAHQTETIWEKPGSTGQEFSAAKFECAKEVQAMMGPQSHASFGPLWYVALAQEEAEKKAAKSFTAMFEMCLQAKGYTKRNISKEEFEYMKEHGYKVY